MNISNLRTFIPCKDFAQSKEFYLDLGFELQWEGKDLIIFGSKEQNFFLQDAYLEEWANNCMMQLHVDNLDDLYNTTERLKAKYPMIRTKPIFTADYGRTFHLIGPAGVLWHMTEVERK